MNINDVQKQNNETNVQSAMTYYTKQKEGSNNFSYYVEVSKSIENKSQLLENEQSEPQLEQEELLVQEGLPSDENANTAYLQSLQNLNAELFDLGISEAGKGSKRDKFTYNINLSELTLDDIKLFDGLAQKSTELAVNSFDTQKGTFNLMINNEGLNVSYRSLEVSKTLFTAIENASKTGKPVRLDFGKDASVILKISKDGKLSAEFVPNDKAMEVMLRNALPELKAKFDEEKLPYNELSYRNFNQQKQNNKENKEKKDE